MTSDPFQADRRSFVVSRKPLVRRVVQKSLSDKEDIKNSFCYSKSAVCQLHKNSKRRTFR